MGALGRADCHCGEVQVGNRVGRDGGGHGGLLPGRVGVVDQVARKSKAQADSEAPYQLAKFGLSGNVSLAGSWLVDLPGRRRYG